MATVNDLHCIGDALFQGDLQVNGDVGIGTNNPTEKLHVIGNIRSSAEVHAGTKVVIASKVEQVYDSVNQSLKFNFL